MLAYQDLGGRISCLQRICLDSPGNSDSEEHTREAETMSEDRIPDSLGETDYSHSKSPHTPCRDSQIFTTPTTVSSAFQKERPVINISHSLHPLPPTDLQSSPPSHPQPSALQCCIPPFPLGATLSRPEPCLKEVGAASQSSVFKLPLCFQTPPTI